MEEFITMPHQSKNLSVFALPKSRELLTSSLIKKLSESFERLVFLQQDNIDNFVFYGVRFFLNFKYLISSLFPLIFMLTITQEYHLFCSTQFLFSHTLLCCKINFFFSHSLTIKLSIMTLKFIQVTIAFQLLVFSVNLQDLKLEVPRETGLINFCLLFALK